MRLPEHLARLLFWRSEDARARRMREFADTEAFGARDLARAAERVQDPWLRRQLIRHAQDEVRHAGLLAEEGSRPVPTGLGASVVGESAEDTAADIDQMGEIGFIAFVHSAEKRATAEFATHKAALGEKGEFFQSILDDERRHVAWTGHQLDRYREQGRGAEVGKALRDMQWQRIRGAWMWFARRISLVTSTILLAIIYVVGVGPFSLLRPRRATGWVTAQAPQLQRQF